MLGMILESTPANLRGELSRWLIEPKAGVFIGNPTARVRDELWRKVVGKASRGSVMQLWTSHTPQGFACRVYGTPSRQLADVDGMVLVRATPGPSKAPDSAH